MARVRIRVRSGDKILKEGEVKLRDKSFLRVIRKYPARVHRNRKRYKRRHKYGGKNYDEGYK